MNYTYSFAELDDLEVAAYADGRADERKEWLPVLEAFKAVLSMCEAIGDFRNGVTDPTGTIDEGLVRASEIFREAYSAIARVEEKK